MGLNTSDFVSSEKTFVSPRGSIEFTRLNLRGLAETGSISLLLARLDQRALATYIDPHFRGSNWKSLLSISAERTSQNPLFTARLGDASLQLERTIDRNRSTTVQLRYDFRRTGLSNLLVPELVLPEDRSVRLSTVAGTIIHDTRDKPLDPHRSRYETLDLGITPSAFGSNVNFSKLVGQYAYYRPMKAMVWASSIRVGLAQSFAGSRVPTSERFFSGGGNTLRGFPLNGAGPQRTVPVCTDPNNPATCTQITVPVGGNELFILNSELRYPLRIISNLGGVVFYDGGNVVRGSRSSPRTLGDVREGGNVYNNISFSQFVSHYTNSVGIGLRYSTPIGPIRIDVGRNLNPIPGINPTQFYITLGQAF